MSEKPVKVQLTSEEEDWLCEKNREKLAKKRAQLNKAKDEPRGKK